MGDIDLGLRLVSQLMPEALAAPFVGGARVERGALPKVLARDTQLSRRELRTDKVLGLKIDGRDCLLHVEFQTRRDADMPVRVLECSAVVARVGLSAQPVRAARATGAVVGVRAAGARCRRGALRCALARAGRACRQ